jgi:5'-nucleotidase
MHFLLTNDDGIGAAGLETLAAACASLGHRITVLAPHVEQSMCGHRLTTHSPLKLVTTGPERYSLTGTPADCVRTAVFGLGLQPDWVLSGVNHGGNLGQDIYVSGTCAAAREAAYHGIKAAAFSQYMVRENALDWERLQRWLEELLPELLKSPPAAASWVNVNFPHPAPGPLPLPEVCDTVPELAPIPVAFELSPAEPPHGQWLQYSGRYADRGSSSGSDVATAFGGRVSVSQISL